MKKKWKKHIKKWFHYNVLLFGNLSAIAQQTLRLIHSAKIRFAFLLVLFGQLIGCDGFAWSGRYLHIAKVTHRCDRYRSPLILKATNINVFLFQADTMTRSNSKLILLPIKCDLRNLSFMQFLSFRSSAIACNTIFFQWNFSRLAVRVFITTLFYVYQFTMKSKSYCKQPVSIENEKQGEKNEKLANDENTVWSLSNCSHLCIVFSDFMVLFTHPNQPIYLQPLHKDTNPLHMRNRLSFSLIFVAFQQDFSRISLRKSTAKANWSCLTNSSTIYCHICMLWCAYDFYVWIENMRNYDYWWRKHKILCTPKSLKRCQRATHMK